jgi:hypothetical protein
MEIFYEYLPRLHGAATFGKITLCGVTLKSCTLQNGTQRNEICWVMSVLLNVVSCSALPSVILLNEILFCVILINVILTRVTLMSVILLRSAECYSKEYRSRLMLSIVLLLLY